MCYLGSLRPNGVGEMHKKYIRAALTRERIPSPLSKPIHIDAGPESKILPSHSVNLESPQSSISPDSESAPKDPFLGKGKPGRKQSVHSNRTSIHWKVFCSIYGFLGSCLHFPLSNLHHLLSPGALLLTSQSISCNLKPLKHHPTNSRRSLSVCAILHHLLGLSLEFSLLDY